MFKFSVISIVYRYLAKVKTLSKPSHEPSQCSAELLAHNDPGWVTLIYSFTVKTPPDHQVYHQIVSVYRRQRAGVDPVFIVPGVTKERLGAFYVLDMLT